MKMNNFIQRIKENIKVFYILSLIFVGFAFYWIFLYSWQSDRDTAIEYLDGLLEKDPSEVMKVSNEFSDYKLSRRKLSILKDLRIDLKNKLSTGIFAFDFHDIYCIDKDIYVVGSRVILWLQKDGIWGREKIGFPKRVDLFGIWGNKENSFAVGSKFRN